MSSVLTKFEHWYNGLGSKKPAIQFLVFAISLFGICVLLYARYIFGSRALIFIEQGSDSWAQSVPFFLNAAERFSNLDFSTWNFSQFLGAITIQAINPEYLVSVLGKEHVEAMMLVSQIAKIWFAGIFFYLYTSYWNLRYTARFVSSLGIAFCGRMTALEAWTGYTMEITLAVALIWAFERFLHNPRKFIALPIAFSLMICALGTYGAVLYSFVMLVYVIFRLSYGQHRLDTSRRIALFCVQLFGLYLFGIALSALTFLPGIESYLNSARVESNSGGIQLPQNFSVEVLAAEILSLFSPALLGSMANYSGPCNTLNNPYFYCGLLSVVSAPFAFQEKQRRQKVALVLLIGISALYFISPSFRYILNGFGVGGYDFRMSSFWITISLSIIGMLGLNSLIERAQPIRTIAIATIISLLLLCAAAAILHEHLKALFFAIAIAFLFLYSVALSHRWKNVFAALLVICFACCAELLVQNYPMVNDVPIVTKDAYAAQYNDDFSSELDRLDGDDDLLYRVDWKTTLLARSMAYGYRGTQTYIGGTGFEKTQNEFVKNVSPSDYLETLGFSRYVYGFNDNALNTMLGVRYLVYARDINENEQYYAPFGYSEISNSDDQFIVYENSYALPFLMSYGYEETMTPADFEDLDRDVRGLAMFERCIVPEQYNSDNEQPPITDKPTDSSSALVYSDAILTPSNSVELLFDHSEADYLLVEMDLDAETAESSNLTILVELENIASGESLRVPYLTAVGHEHIVIPVRNTDFSRAMFSIAQINSFNPVEIRNCSIYEAPNDYFDRYLSVCEDKLSENPVVSKASNNEITGSLTMADDGFIVTSIPWSPSWRAYVDGQEAATAPVNYGFVGIQATAGHHDIELTYRDVFRENGVWVSFIALIILLLSRLFAQHRYSKRNGKSKL